MRSQPDQQGPGAPPRKNGELVFREPWESRAFGMVMSLHEQGLFAWDEFREHLIAAIARWDRAHPEAASGGDSEDYVYYEHWLAAFEALLEKRALCRRSEVQERTRRFAARPPGHDHAHDGSHDHARDHSGDDSGD